MSIRLFIVVGRLILRMAAEGEIIAKVLQLQSYNPSTNLFFSSGWALSKITYDILSGSFNPKRGNIAISSNRLVAVFYYFLVV